jgi:hypothetical protein
MGFCPFLLFVGGTNDRWLLTFRKQACFAHFPSFPAAKEERYQHQLADGYPAHAIQFTSDHLEHNILGRLKTKLCLMFWLSGIDFVWH